MKKTHKQTKPKDSERVPQESFKLDSGSDHASIEAKMRPSEKVRHFLQVRFLDQAKLLPARLPTISEIAAGLKVSRPTVQSVIADLARKGFLQTRAGDGTYLVVKSTAAQRVYKLGINSYKSHSWAGHIYSGILAAAMESPAPVQICPLSIVRAQEKEFVSRFVAAFPDLDGYILLPPFNTNEVIGQIKPSGKPWVSFNPCTPHSTANFVAPDYYGASVRVGHAWALQGRKKILYITTRSPQITASDMLRVTGLTNGLKMISQDADVHIERVVETTQCISYALIERLIREKSELPDAIYCMGDYLALGCVEALGEFDQGIPEAVSVIGGSGMNLQTFARPDITRMDLAFHRVGQELIRMILRRLQTDGEDQVGTYVASSFLGLGTTTEKENEILLDSPLPASAMTLTQ